VRDEGRANQKLDNLGTEGYDYFTRGGNDVAIMILEAK
jgi:hypothetical protein